MNLLTLTNFHKHYGSLLIGLILAVIVVTLLKGPKPAFQRVVAVLVDINLVIGLATAWKIAPNIIFSATSSVSFGRCRIITREC
jgi:multisubunit Na+/H+ antiporter MnhE subunit